MPQSHRLSIIWFRDDLRLSDHAALTEAAHAESTLCIYVFDENSPGLRALGGAARWWLNHSLASLSSQLEAKGGRLDILAGRAGEIIPSLAHAAKADVVHWTRRYGLVERRIDGAVASALAAQSIQVEEHDGFLIHDPARFAPKSGGSYKVFTPFWKALKQANGIGKPTPSPSKISSPPWPKGAPARVRLEDLNLTPTHPDWAGGLRESWSPGEPGARRQLKRFIDSGLPKYALGRDFPALSATSRMSPHLRFGELSPRQVWRAAEHAAARAGFDENNLAKFCSELAWREFCYHLLFHFPQLATQNLDAKYDRFPWRISEGPELAAWRRGKTGFPIVDAGMRELWRTGAMHNRVRMITASFLVKDLLIDWRVGEEWFWDALCDADPANNAAGWQWCAGCGADAAPYFRIYNPTLQSKKFDPEGVYLRQWLPELRTLSNADIHEPSACPPAVLKAAGIVLGETYPHPIVDHKRARERALAASRAAKESF